MDSELRRMLKRMFAVCTVLGITMTIGALTHDNDPRLSIAWLSVSLAILISLNINKEDN